MNKQSLSVHVQNAAQAVRAGGVIAYPTEYCFGLGCDPENIPAVQKLLAIKQRAKEQGVILIAADEHQVRRYAHLDQLERLPEIMTSWPGPNTWLLPVRSGVSEWLCGSHTSIAMRIPDHTFCLALCQALGHALVSTSANRHGQAALLSAEAVEQEMQTELDYIVPLPVGGAEQASTIRDAKSGRILR